MAFALYRTTVGVTVEDEAGDVTSKIFTVTGADEATREANAAALVADFVPLTNGRVDVYTVNHTYYDSAASAPAAGSEIENRALVTLKLDAATNQQEYANMEIPAPVIGIFAGTSGPNKNVVDVADAALVTFFARFQAGTGVAVLADNQTVDYILKGKRIHKASRKG